MWSADFFTQHAKRWNAFDNHKRCNVRKGTFEHVRPVTFQISLHINAV